MRNLINALPFWFVLFSPILLGALSLEEFTPYRMFDYPVEKVENPHDFALQQGIPVAGVTNEFQMHVDNRGVKKLFSLYKETVGDHVFFHAYYLTSKNYSYDRFFSPEYMASPDTDPMTAKLPWKEDIYDLVEDEFEYGDMGGTSFPMVYERLYLQGDEGLLFLADAEYFLSFELPLDKDKGWKIETLQPWATGEEYGYWSITYIDSIAEYWVTETFKTRVMNYHQALRISLDEEGQEKWHITVKASNPLIDKDNPFRYTVQNAFDQNPATSYVEDTEDDLMILDFSWSKEFREKIYVKNGEGFLKQRVINGYAENEGLYHKNNRLKSYWGYTLDDHTLGYQYEELMDETEAKLDAKYGLYLVVQEIYRGTKYNDTCLAELDFQFANFKWLFGGVDE